MVRRSNRHHDSVRFRSFRAHCVNLAMRCCGTVTVCSNSNCGMSAFLVNQLVVDDKTRKQMTKSELNARVTYSRLWK